MDSNWHDKIAAQQRHEHLAATVRIAVGELCYLAEQNADVEEQVYAIANLLEVAVKEDEVAYAD